MFYVMKVISIITNNPIFVELQYKSLKKYLHIDYEYIVFNDGKYWPDSTNFGNPIENGKIAIENKCKEFDIKCYNLPNELHKNYDEPSVRHSDSLKLLVSYMKGNIDEYLILDGDMFLIDDLNIEKYREKMCVCVLQERPNIKYIWPNLFYINMNKIKYIDDFNLHSLGINYDTGSSSYKWLQKYYSSYPNVRDIIYSNRGYENDDFYFIKHLWSCSWSEDEFPENLKTKESIIKYIKEDERNENGKYFVEIYDNCIFHYRGGTWLGLNNIELHKKLLNKLKLI